MSNKLYEDALADVRKLTEVAENNAKQAVLNAVVPRIQRLIENELLGGDSNIDTDEMSAEDVLTDPGAIEDLGLEDAVSQPDQEGKVTLDLDALQVEPGDESGEFELSMESKSTLKALRANKDEKGLNGRIKLIENEIKKYKNDKSVTSEQISRMIARVENTYDYVQETIEASKGKETLEERLESFYKDLANIQENMSTKQNKRKLNEDEQLDLDADASGDDVDLDSEDEGSDGGGELTLKLTGLPADVDLDGIGVDLVGDDADSDEGDDLDLGGDEGSDDDEVMDLDLGADDQGDEQEVHQESRSRRDNQIVEIDEGMLRKEIKRMALLRENSEKCDSNGNGVDAAAMDDFGGGHEEGEAFLDGKVTTESDEDMLESDDVMDVSETKSNLRKEAVLQRRIRSAMQTIKAEARGSRGRKLVELKSRFSKLNTRFTESVKRTNKFKKQLSESVSQSRRSNSVAQRHTDKAVQNLRTKLAESNLQTVKLAYANKVLQSDVLNPRQRASVIKALDECNTAREAKLVYTSVVQRLSASQRSLSESKVVGSGSRVTKQSGSTAVLNEGFQTERWAKLAGIK